MKKIGFINTPLTSAHAVRGVGFYTRNLLKHLVSLSEQYGFNLVEIASPSDGFDLIHYPYFDLFSHSLPIVRQAKTLVTVHDVIPLEYPDIYQPGIKGRVNFYLQKLALGTVSSVLTDSFASVNSIKKYLSVPDAKINLIYLAASDVFKPRQKSLSISQKYSLPEKFVLYVGDINWNKNISTLVRACISKKLHLVLVGKNWSVLQELSSDHPELSHLKDLKEICRSPFIHRLGFVPESDLVSVYNLATVYCQPSMAEGFGLPVLEAMSCGTPVVCSNSHSLPEIAGDAALYFNPLDLERLEQLLNSVFVDSGLRSSLSQKGKSQSKKFSWENTAKNTLQVYKNLL